MANRMGSPKGVLERINTVTHKWETLRPTKSFSGLTLEQFKEAVKPSLEVRAEIADLEGRLQAAKARRATVDPASIEVIRAVVNAVKGDREEGGENGELYAAMGFVPKSARSSGLTRRRPNGNGEAKHDESS